MKTNNISKSIVSISSPGTSLWATSPKQSADLTRKCNEFAASLKKHYPDKFGYWASLPLPFVNETMAEIQLALSEGADGFALLTNYQGHYLGDPIFEPIFAVLNENKARLFMHPTVPCTHASHQSEYTSNITNSSMHPNTFLPATPMADIYPIPIFEFFFDTTRALTNLLLRGAISRHQGVKLVVPHAGATFPPILSRMSLFPALVPGAFAPESGVAPISEEEIKRLFDTRIYFDMAGMIFPGQLKGMLANLGIKPTRLLYGSDYPFTSGQGVQALAAMMDNGLPELIGEDGKELAYEANAAAFLAA